MDENDEDGEEELDESGGSESESDDELGQSTSLGGTRPGMPMTARQAALAGLSTSNTPLISLGLSDVSSAASPFR